MQARLNRAYLPATQYLAGFSSNLASILARNLAFVAGAVLAVLIILTVYDEDVITVEHVLTIMTALGAVVAGKISPPFSITSCKMSIMNNRNNLTLLSYLSLVLNQSVWYTKLIHKYYFNISELFRIMKESFMPFYSYLEGCCFIRDSS